MTTYQNAIANQVADQYILLIHSLTHEDNREYIDRHLLLMEKWTRDYEDGFYIRDLDYIIQLMVILRDRYSTHPQMFRQVISTVLRICSKPLLEATANERLRSRAVSQICAYLLEIANFWTMSGSDSRLKTQVGRCFRCISNGGSDPTILRADRVDIVGDLTKQPVIDQVYLQNLIRESRVIETIVSEFIVSVDDYRSYRTEIKLPSSASSSLIQHSKSPASTTNDINGTGAAATSIAVAASGSGRADYDSDDDMNPPLPPPPISNNSNSNTHADADADGDGYNSNNNNNNNSGSGNNGGGNSGGGSLSSAADTRKADMVAAKELTQVMLDLCCDLAVDDRSAADMCLHRFCDGAVRLLQEAAFDDPRDPRVSELVNIMWTMLETYLNQHPKTHNGVGSVFYSNNVVGGSWGGEEFGGSQAEEDKLILQTLISIDIIDFEPCVSILRDLFLRLLRDGYRLADKECRNEIIVVLCMMARFPAAYPCFVQNGLLNSLITYSCVAEAGKKAWPFYSYPLAKLRNFSSVFDVDLQFKRALWMIVSDLLSFNDPDAILCLASSPLLATLLMYNQFDTLDPAPKTSVDNQFGLMSPTREGSSILFKNKNKNKNISQDSYMRDDSMESSNILGGSGSGVVMESSSSGNLHMHNIGDGDGDKGGVDAANSTASAALSLTQSPSPYQEDPIFVAEKNFFLKSLPANQLRGLQVLAMTFLAQNAPKALAEFLRINGPVKTLDIIFHYYKSPVVEHKEIIYNATLLLNRCIMNSNIVRQLMEEENAIQTLLYLLEHSDDDRTRTQAARIIAMLCSDHNTTAQSQLRSQNGIINLIKIINIYTEVRRPSVGKKAGIKLSKQNGADEEIEDPSEDPRSGDVSILVVSVLDCLSKGVVGNRKSEARFAKEEGIDAILELLEISPYIVRSQILRILCDLFENRRLLTFLHAWRSPKTMRSAAQLTAHCWLDEEYRLEGRRMNGIIGNVFDPLGNHDWPDDRITQVPGESVSSSSVADTTRSLAVTRLANAIVASRGAYGSVPLRIRSQVLEKDTRVVIAYILQLMGMFNDSNSGNGSGNGGISSPMLSKGGRNSFSGDDEEKNGFNFAADSPTGNVDDDGNGNGNGYGDGDIAFIDQQKDISFNNNSNSNNMNKGDRGGKKRDDELNSMSECVSADNGNGNHQHNNGVVMTTSSDLGLNASDKQVISIAKRYFLLREGEWWRQVVEDLASEGVIPIEADAATMEAYVERSFDASVTVQMEQMDLYAMEAELKKGEEGTFVDAILTKKQQQIKAEWLKRNGRHKGAGTISPFAIKF